MLLRTEHQCKTSLKLALNKTFFQSTFNVKVSTGFEILEQNFKTVLSQFFYVVFANLKDKTKKSY